jgi:hypothetical protein
MNGKLKVRLEKGDKLWCTPIVGIDIKYRCTAFDRRDKIKYLSTRSIEKPFEDIIFDRLNISGADIETSQIGRLLIRVPDDYDCVVKEGKSSYVVGGVEKSLFCSSSL